MSARKQKQANRSKATDEVDRYAKAANVRRLAHFQDLDEIRRSRLKKSTLFEMDASPALLAVQAEFGAKLITDEEVDLLHGNLPFINVRH